MRDLTLRLEPDITIRVPVMCPVRAQLYRPAMHALYQDLKSELERLPEGMMYVQCLQQPHLYSTLAHRIDQQVMEEFDDSLELFRIACVERRLSVSDVRDQPKHRIRRFTQRFLNALTLEQRQQHAAAYYRMCGHPSVRDLLAERNRLMERSSLQRLSEQSLEHMKVIIQQTNTEAMGGGAGGGGSGGGGRGDDKADIKECIRQCEHNIINQMKHLFSRSMRRTCGIEKASPIIQAFPKLMRSISINRVQLTRHVGTMLGRVVKDRDILAMTLAIPQTWLLREVHIKGCETHKMGQNTAVLVFVNPDDGHTSRIIYKPASVWMDAMIMGDLGPWEQAHRRLPARSDFFPPPLPESLLGMLAREQPDVFPDATYRVVPMCRGDDPSEDYGYSQYLEHQHVPDALDLITTTYLRHSDEAYPRAPRQRVHGASHAPLARALNAAMHDFDEQLRTTALADETSPFLLPTEASQIRFDRSCCTAIALAALLGLTDCHIENALVSRGLFTLIDLEICFDPTLFSKLLSHSHERGIASLIHRSCLFHETTGALVPGLTNPHTTDVLFDLLPIQSISLSQSMPTSAYIYDAEREQLRLYTPQLERLPEALETLSTRQATVLAWASALPPTLTLRTLPLSTSAWLELMPNLQNTTKPLVDAYRLNHFLKLYIEDKQRTALVVGDAYARAELQSGNVPVYYLRLGVLNQPRARWIDGFDVTPFATTITNGFSGMGYQPEDLLEHARALLTRDGATHRPSSLRPLDDEEAAAILSLKHFIQRPSPCLTEDGYQSPLAQWMRWSEALLQEDPVVREALSHQCFTVMQRLYQPVIAVIPVADTDLAWRPPRGRDEAQDAAPRPS